MQSPDMATTEELGTTTRNFDLHPRGPFSLRASATFGFGQRVAFSQRTSTGDDGFDGAMRMAFCLDGYRHPWGWCSGNPTPGSRLRRTVAPPHWRTWLRCAPDRTNPQPRPRRRGLRAGGGAGRGGRRAAGVGSGVATAVVPLAVRGRGPGRCSPPVAPAAQMAKVREELNMAHGSVFSLDSRRITAFPTPAELLGVSTVGGLDAERSAGCTASLKPRWPAGSTPSGCSGWAPTPPRTTCRPCAGSGPLRCPRGGAGHRVRRRPAHGRASPAHPGPRSLRAAGAAGGTGVHGPGRGVAAVPHLGVGADPLDGRAAVETPFSAVSAKVAAASSRVMRLRSDHDRGNRPPAE